jgi:hypothetical protein
VIPPRLSAQAFRQGSLSTLRPRTWVSIPSNQSSTFWYEGI